MEKERPSYVLRKMDRQPYISVGREIGCERQGDRQTETQVECRRGGAGVASRRWWERPAISRREGMCFCVCVCMCVIDVSGGMHG